DLAAELIARCAATGHSRFPVFGSDLDDIVGVVHVKSVYRLSAGERPGVPVHDLMDDVLAVPETRSLDDLLDDMRESHRQLAV
ncbi:MAG TPA: hypothetical protein DDZ64_07365, partial [Acidimicrobiaceae bacterium]|nr:hypothetical protein [Acidimicrobiaceae bacterium]